MNRRQLELAVVVAAVLATLGPSLHAATILERTVKVRIESPTRVVESNRLRVRLDSATDLDAWRVYSIYQDENRVLRDVVGVATQPDGSKKAVKRKQKDTVEGFSSSFHDSASFEMLTFSELEVGSVLTISWTEDVTPYYSEGRVVLLTDDPTSSLSVTVEGGGEALRWRIAGPDDGLEIVETAGGFRLSGRDLEGIEAPALAPEGSSSAMLHYAWASDPSWEGVGRWYLELLDGVPRASEAVRAEARDLTSGIEDPRQRLEALLGFAQRQVRYVAVEVGIGGYRPTSPGETLERRWGDCKDKSLLLVDLLEETGIEAHPALIRLARQGRIDTTFPAPSHFNHMIVAVPETAVATTPTDPVGDGFLFVDPTQTYGTAGWLGPGVQNQHALIVRDGCSEMALTPISHVAENRRLLVDLEVRPDGGAEGLAALELSGWRATGFIAQGASQPAARSEEDVRAVFARLLPGVTLGKLGWVAKEDSAVPALTMSAEVRINSLVQGIDSGVPSFALPGLRSTPETSLFAEREHAMVVTPQTSTVLWRMVLPEGFCRPAEKTREVSNELGSFRQRIVHDSMPGRFTLERASQILQRWVEAEELSDLKALALAEHRAGRRRIRMVCNT